MHKKTWFSAFVICSFSCALITYQALNTQDAHLAPLPETTQKTQQTKVINDLHLEPTTNEQSCTTNSTSTSSKDVHLSPKLKHNERIIKVKNSITKKMISYNKCFVSYTPHFTLSINDLTLRPGQEQEITVIDNKLDVSYSYNFLNGYKKGTKKVAFEIDPKQDLYEITFSWQNDWRVMIEQATPKKISVIS